MTTSTLEPSREYIWENGDCLQEYDIYLDKWFCLVIFNGKSQDKSFNQIFDEKEGR